MPSGGSLTLGDVADRVAVLVVACSRCHRSGRYNLDRLIAQHGPDYPIPTLLRTLSDDCPKRTSISINDQCGVNCPDLPKLFL